MNVFIGANIILYFFSRVINSGKIGITNKMSFCFSNTQFLMVTQFLMLVKYQTEYPGGTPSLQKF